jgi:alpha-beta hydrolase superfamily lysophospholipase
LGFFEETVVSSRRLAASALGIVVIVVLGGLLYAKGLHPAHPAATLARGSERARGSGRLVVLVKGGSADVATYAPLTRRLLNEPELAGSDLLVFDHQLSRLTPGHLYDFATRLRAEIDAQWIRHGGYDDVILAGHSTGSLLVRAAYLQSAGRDPRQPRTVPWSDRVSRVVLLAGIGRGVDAEERGRWSWVLSAGRFIPLIRSSVMYDVLRGADFVTDVRIAWIRYFSELSAASMRDASAPRPPIVVELLGTEDDVLARDDNIDLEQFPTAYHIDVPGAGHQTLHRLELTANPELTYALFREAFVSRVFPSASRRSVMTDSVHRIVFLLHGLRSSRDEWVHEIAPMLRAQLPGAEIVESSYGWISMLGFALPSVRRRELKWLEDHYTEALARHPGATIDVVAHSNGSYLVGEALRRVPSMRFGRVVLLGSVLPADYAWSQRQAWGQAQAVRTDRAGDDLVVAVLCSALHGVGMTDVGTSGWTGFDETGGVETEMAWYQGGHSAALASNNLANLASFVSTGRNTATGMTLASGPPRSVALLSQLAPWVARLMLLASIAGAVWWLRKPVGRGQRLTLAAVGVALVMVALDVL